MTDERRERTTDDAARRKESARALAIGVARALQDARCEDIVVIDVTALSQVTDFIVIASGTSDRQMASAADDAKEHAANMGERVFGRSSDAASTWIVMDLVDVVVHIFEPNARAYYDLEMLWGDGPRVEWERSRGERAAGRPGGGASGGGG